MNLGLTNKVALVTGASKGIGLATAKGLAAEGAKVVLSARGEKTLMSAVETIRLSGGEAMGVVADVSKQDDIENLFEELEARFGQADILVANAGGPPPGKAEEVQDDAWLKGFDLTLMSSVRLAKRALPAMKETRWGRIINITSVSIKQPVANLTLSNAFRAGVTGFAKTLSTELAPYGVTVNNVGPGYTATERLQQLFTNDEVKHKLLDTIPAKRFGTPEEIAAAALFLASEQAAYMTGQTLIVDGGVTSATY